jgi:hypothetical protein
VHDDVLEANVAMREMNEELHRLRKTYRKNIIIHTD